MININTLNELNRYGIGADIARLESYIVDYKQASLVTNMYEYEHDYLRMNKILKELKPDSLAFTDKTTLNEEDTNSNDKLLMKYNNRPLIELYGSNDIHMSKLCNYIESLEDGCMDMVAIPNVLGINIRCSYINGYLYKINIIGHKYTYKYLDITSRFDNQLPKYVEEFSKYGLVELRGKVTIFNNHEDLQNISLNVECSTMHLLRLDIDNDSISIVIDDLFIDTEDDLTLKTYWNKLEFIRELGFNVPHHALIRNVENHVVGDAFNSFKEYFDNIENTSGIIYKYSGYQIVNNKEIDCEQDYSRVLYVYDRCDYKQLFSTKLKSVLTIASGSVDIILNVVSVKCNDCLTIDKIEVDDINILNTYDLKPGSTVFFFVNNGKAILTKKNNHQI